MLLQNNSKRSFVHSKLDENYKLKLLTLAPGQILEVPDDVAKSWLKDKDIVEYVDPKVARQQQEKMEKENEQLKEELQALKATTKKSTSKKSKKK